MYIYFSFSFESKVDKTINNHSKLFIKECKSEYFRCGEIID